MDKEAKNVHRIIFVMLFTEKLEITHSITVMQLIFVNNIVIVCYSMVALFGAHRVLILLSLLEFIVISEI